MDPNIIGREHYDIARGVQKILQDYKSLQDIIAILGKLRGRSEIVRIQYQRNLGCAFPTPYLPLVFCFCQCSLFEQLYYTCPNEDW